MTVRAARIVTGALFLLAAAGCVVPQDRYGQEDETTAALEEWIGELDRDLVFKWGAPDAVYQMQDGGRILTWRRSRTESTGGELYTETETRTIDGEDVGIPVTRRTPIVTTRYECVMSVELDVDGYVVAYTTEGNDCTAPPLPDY